MTHEKLKEQVKTELVCSDCGLPIAGDVPRTDVTRYLAETSRCQCRRFEDKAKDEANGAGKGTATVPKMAIAVKVGFSNDEAAEILGERFTILSFLGQGGMGSVFKVKERATDKIFAVKLLNPQLMHDEHSVKRFEQEARAALHLTHAHLAAVYEYGIGKDGTPFLVMDYLEGVTLDQILQNENHLDPVRAVNLFIQICEAISYAHFKGVIHRDIKPANIMVMQPSPGLDYAKLFDFGIAKVLPDQAIDFTQDMSQTSDLCGSPLYMSPEQCKGLTLDPRTDVYSLGCVMYKALTGKHPFEGKNFVDTVVRIVTTEPEPLSTAQLKSSLPQGLEKVVARCLSKDPDSRYGSAALLQADLERIRDGKPVSTTPSVRKTADENKKIQSKRNLLIITALIAVAACVMSVLFVPMNPHKDAENLDGLSYKYYNQGKYDQAIPLLEFGIKTYTKQDSFLADNYNHLGKCYLKLKQYEKAVPNYKDSLKLYKQWGNYPGSQMGEAVRDYAEVLRNLNRSEEADTMVKEFQRTNTINNIP